MTTLQLPTVLQAIVLFYGLVIWFLCKTSAYFHKMDEKVGNTEKEKIIFLQQ